MELAQFYSVMANLLVDENQMELAEQRNQQAIALLDELAMPSSSLRMERAEALKLRDWLLNPESKRNASGTSARFGDIGELRNSGSLHHIPSSSVSVC